MFKGVHHLTPDIISSLDPGVVATSKMPCNSLFNGAASCCVIVIGADRVSGMFTGGGFHRYSVDEMWHIPHFEKVLVSAALPPNPFACAPPIFLPI